MQDDHPSNDDFEGFLSARPGPGSAARNAKVLRHLLAECVRCHRHLSHLGWADGKLERLVFITSEAISDEPRELMGDKSPLLYEQAFSKAEKAVEAFLQEAPGPELPVEALLESLTKLGPADQLSSLDLAPRYFHPDLVLRLIDFSHSFRFSDPRKVHEFARLALHLATGCTPEACGNPRKLQDLRGLAWSQFATALRLTGRLREAEEAGAKSRACIKEGTGDPVLRATILRQLASVQMALRRFDEAIEMLRSAGLTAREAGDSQALATTLILEAIATIYAGEAEIAIRLLNQAIPLIDQEAEPYLLLLACHNLVRCYIDLDRPEQALALHSEFHDLHHEIKDILISLKMSWHEGVLLRDLGHPQAAEVAFLRARSGFLERGMMYEVAIISLDLGALYIRMGRVDDVQRTVETTLPVFRALGIAREEVGALLQLQQVAGQKQRALELVRFLNSRMQSNARDEVLR